MESGDSDQGVREGENPALGAGLLAAEAAAAAGFLGLTLKNDEMSSSPSGLSPAPLFSDEFGFTTLALVAAEAGGVMGRWSSSPFSPGVPTLPDSSLVAERASLSCLSRSMLEGDRLSPLTEIPRGGESSRESLRMGILGALEEPSNSSPSSLTSWRM